MLDVALPEAISPRQAFDQVESHFAGLGTTCWQWIMNPSAPPRQTTPMIEHLESIGYKRDASNVMYLDRITSRPVGKTEEGLKIIPARASFRHARALHEESSRRWNEPQLADTAVMHLDDPHYDSLIALRDGVGVAHVGVLAMGEIGLIEEVFVSEPARRCGLGTTMMSRALEICARSLFKHVLLCCAADNTPAIRLYEKFGFRKIGDFVEYQKPS
jgi:GNAT superfamily N-acetyltransferase